MACPSQPPCRFDTKVESQIQHSEKTADSVNPENALAALDRIPYWLIALAARVFPAAIFWQSGQTKVSGLHLKPSAITFFANEYQLPIIDPTAAAYLSAFSEHLLPVLLVLGLAARFAAFGLLFMTVVIEIFVNARRLGHVLFPAHRARSRRDFHRPFDRAPFQARARPSPLTAPVVCRCIRPSISHSRH
jgi:uncharacterized membrane protein YphA (DoxX/SURF4 family)